MAKTLTVGGKKYKVIEDLGCVSHRDQYAKVVLKDGADEIVVRDIGTRSWEFANLLFKVLPPKPNTLF